MSEPQTQESLSLIVQRISHLVHEVGSLGMTHLVVNLECMQCLLIFEVATWLNDDSSTSENRGVRALPASKDSIEAMPRLESLSLKEDEHCAVCLEGYERGGEAREMPCKHKFHSSCIELWLKVKGSCPICRFGMPVVEEEGRGQRRKNRVVMVARGIGGHMDFYEDYMDSDFENFVEEEEGEVEVAIADDSSTQVRRDGNMA